MHIVVCDDLEQDAQKTKHFLEAYFSQHHMILPKIDIVHTSKELWQQQPIDLLFLDIELAGELGISVAEEVKSPAARNFDCFCFQLSLLCD